MARGTTKQKSIIKTCLIIAAIYTTFKTIVKLKLETNSGLNGIRTQDHCDISAVLYQLSYQASWELVTLWDRNRLVDWELYKWICGYIWPAPSWLYYWWIKICSCCCCRCCLLYRWTCAMDWDRRVTIDFIYYFICKALHFLFSGRPVLIVVYSKSAHPPGKGYSL